jgi:hypothetical protein
MLFEYWKRLDQFDYEIIGVEEWWSINKTAQMLTSFEMENKGYFDREDANAVFSKLFNKYEKYIINILTVCSFEINTPPNALPESYFPKDTILINPLTTTFPQKAFIDDVDKNNTLKVDIDRLRRFLSGDEAPNVCTPIRQEIVPQDATIQQVYEPTVHINAKTNDVGKDQYRFEKTAQSWNLQFGDVELIGVKDLVGMDYIKLLLMNPGEPIGVIEMQAMLNPEYIKAAGRNRRGELDDQTESASSNSNHAKVKGMKTSLDKLKRRLQELSQERNELDSDYDHIELERIDNETACIEQEIDRIRYSKDEDPEIKRNRDKISKNITAALNNIKDVEQRKGHKDAPLYNYLELHIKTGSTCEYTPPVINPPQWLF